MYICAGDGPERGKGGGDPSATIGPEPNAETCRYVQGTFGSVRDIGTDIRSTLVAMNVTNHKVAWRRLLDNRCAGSITTAGGLIFAGRFNGELTALNSDTGQRLGSFQTDGGFKQQPFAQSTVAWSNESPQRCTRLGFLKTRWARSVAREIVVGGQAASGNDGVASIDPRIRRSLINGRLVVMKLRAESKSPWLELVRASAETGVVCWSILKRNLTS